MRFCASNGSCEAWIIILMFLATLPGCSLAVDKKIIGEVIADYCHQKTFKADCASDEVIVMTSAQYGRMRLGSCININKGHLPCSSVVLPDLDRKCSGRQQCEFPVKELDGSQPCPANLTPYLRAGYVCQKVVSGPRSFCVSGKPLRQTAQRGYIASDVTVARTLGSPMCPWQIRVKPGQTINITLIDFSTLQQSDDYEEAWSDQMLRYKYAVIREGTNARTVTQIEGAEREKQIYASTTNVVTIEITSKEQSAVHFLLKYEAVGCATTNLPAGVWIRRHATGALVTCNRTGEVWHLTCVDNRWIGRVSNCSQPRGGEKHWNLKHLLDESDSFPFGILAVVAIGVALGILLGGVALIFTYRCLRTKYEQDTSGRYNQDTWINEEGKLMSTYDRPSTDMRMETSRNVGGRTSEVLASPPCMSGSGDNEPAYTEYGVLPPSGYRRSKDAVHVYESPQFRRKDH